MRSMFSRRSHSDNENVKVNSKSHYWLLGKSSLTDPVWCRGYWSRTESENNGRIFQYFSIAAKSPKSEAWLKVSSTQQILSKYLWHEWRAPKGKRNSVWEKAKRARLWVPCFPTAFIYLLTHFFPEEQQGSHTSFHTSPIVKRGLKSWKNPKLKW